MAVLLSLELISFILGVLAIMLAVSAMFFSWVFYREGTKLYLDMRDLLAEVRETSNVTKDATQSILGKAIDRLGVSSKDIVKHEVDKSIDSWKKEFVKDFEDVKKAVESSDVDDKIKKIEFKVETLAASTAEIAENASGEIVRNAKAGEIIDLLRNRNVRLIFEALLEEPEGMSAGELSELLDVHVTSIGPKVHKLVNLGLIIKDKSVDEGMRINFYSIHPEYLDPIKEVLERQPKKGHYLNTR